MDRVFATSSHGSSHPEGFAVSAGKWASVNALHFANHIIAIARNALRLRARSTILVLVRLELGASLGEQNFRKWGRKVQYLHEIGCGRGQRVLPLPKKPGQYCRMPAEPALVQPSQRLSQDVSTRR